MRSDQYGVVMTVTGELLDELEDAFASVSSCEFADRSAGFQVAKAKMDAANALNFRGTAFADAKRAARLYGECAAIGIGNQSSKLEVDARSRFAQLVACTVVPNRDEARVRSAELFRRVGDDLFAQRETDHAAMMWTNSAVAILEMRNPTSEQLDDAHSLLEKTLRMRKKGSVDVGYGQMNLALAELKTIYKFPADQRAARYSQILKSFDRGARTLEKHEGAHYRSTYHNNVVETLVDWLEHEISQSQEKLYTQCLPSDFPDTEAEFLSAANTVRILVQNPGVLGLSETPEWVPTHPEIVRDALARIPTLDQRLESAESFIAADGELNHPLRMKIFKLKSLLTELRGLPDPPFDSFDADWDAGLYEDYLVSALTFLTWTEAVKYPEDQFVILVRRVIDCVLALRAAWSPQDVERLLMRQSVAFRFAACELGRLGYWKDGFRLLEATRGIVSSRSFNELSPASDEPDSNFSEVTWVHVSNSPRAAYVFILQLGNYFGREFEGLGGKELTAELVSLARGGLLVSQDRNRSLAKESALRISNLLEPIANWIDEQSGHRVVLSPGGYFQTFPLWACGRLGDNWLAGRKLIASAPSRTIAIQSADAETTPMVLATLAVHEASSVPEHTALKWSQHEPAAIREIAASSMTVGIFSATRSALITSLQTADAVHFTGHSSADFDPHGSSLITYGDPLTVREILEATVSSSLVVLASCQSALARNMQRQDEMLSIQTAMFYAGATCVVGASWPIIDSAGFVFTVKFYEALAHAEQQGGAVTVETVIGACTASLSWMRDASIAETNLLMERYGAPGMSGDAQENAFGFYEWAAIGVVGVP